MEQWTVRNEPFLLYIVSRYASKQPQIPLFSGYNIDFYIEFSCLLLFEKVLPVANTCFLTRVILQTSHWPRKSMHVGPGWQSMLRCEMVNTYVFGLTRVLFQLCMCVCASALQNSYVWSHSGCWILEEICFSEKNRENASIVSLWPCVEHFHR